MAPTECNRGAAVFDVDRTLVRGYTERLFFQRLLRRRLPLGRALGYLARVLLDPDRRFRDKGYLKGFPAAEVAAWGRECFEADIRPRLSPSGLACLEEHRREGRAIVLLTGTLALLAEPLRELLQAPWLIATRLKEEEGKLTGAVAGLLPRGENKARLLLELAAAQGLDLSRSYAYGDEVHDVPVFGLVGRPVAVNPGRRLERIARRQGWPVRFF
ncbi:MAG: HAD-IB family hydrolase [Deltaproteobacteria bacterium]|nr:HAD-IB family hydrolase [Deltaproteobacteria bacterium]